MVLILPSRILRLRMYEAMRINLVVLGDSDLLTGAAISWWSIPRLPTLRHLHSPFSPSLGFRPKQI